VIEKTITIFRNKKPKKTKIWTFGVFKVFLKSLKNLGFLKATSTALAFCDKGQEELRHLQLKTSFSFFFDLPFFATFSFSFL